MEKKEMEENRDQPPARSTLLMLFVGFSGIIVSVGFLALLLWVCRAWGVDWRTSTKEMAAIRPWLLLFLVLWVALAAWGILRLRGCRSMARSLLSMFAAAILCVPICGAAVLAVLLGCFFGGPVVASLIQGPDLAMSAVSPDGEFEAYVVETPSIDPPNQALYIDRNDEAHFVIVGNLVEDVDAIKAIHWSPWSDMVVFETRHNLIATRTPGYETVKLPLGAEFKRHRPGRWGAFSGGGPVRGVEDIAFPERGAFSYRLEREAEPRLVRMDVF
jgi:hypothetical protein